ncbi:MAG: hypothetical protein K2H20_03890, partial [Bacilli bacterium]|nr:hypothetical protein [Bacilli bacterium]
MRLRQQEYIRLLSFVAALGSSFMARNISSNISELINTYNLTMEDISKICYIFEYITILGASRMERFTQEHKQIKSIYSEVIKNDSVLFRIVQVVIDRVK